MTMPDILYEKIWDNLPEKVSVMHYTLGDESYMKIKPTSDENLKKLLLEEIKKDPRPMNFFIAIDAETERKGIENSLRVLCDYRMYLIQKMKTFIGPDLDVKTEDIFRAINMNLPEKINALQYNVAKPPYGICSGQMGKEIHISREGIRNFQAEILR